MRWLPRGTSSDVEDRRGEGGGGFGGFGGRMGLGGAAVLLVLSLIFGRNFFSPAGGSPDTGAAPTSGPVASTPHEDSLVSFVSFVLDDAQNTWDKIFAQHGQRYQHAKLVLFRDAIQSACGFAQSATGPFYCPGDGKVYVDLGFYDELRRRFGAPGDFAQAYVVAHELGHHVQRLLGTEARVRDDQRTDPAQANQLSVGLELQADCYAGVWARSTAERNVLEPGDIEEGINAAAAVGDDRLQRSAGQAVHPENFTHGTSAQRQRWFQRGYQSGRMEDCDT